jgi:hypothetical protein
MGGVTGHPAAKDQQACRLRRRLRLRRLLRLRPRLRLHLRLRLLHTSLMAATNDGLLPLFSQRANIGNLTMALYNTRASVDSLRQDSSCSSSTYVTI